MATVHLRAGSTTTVDPGPKGPPLPPDHEYVCTLGHGGMGEVYLVRDLTADRLVAIKFLRSIGGDRAHQRFLNEVRTLARLDHPNIVRVLAHDFQRAVPYFTMEYVGGGTLAQKVTQEGPLAPQEAARLIAIVARAVHEAHCVGILHRDIKPGNILLTESGVPRLSDFGLAKRTDQDLELTTGDGPLGTLSYMPPEQTHRGPIDGRADVYGLGATLYHLLTGQPPFSGPQPEILRRLALEPPERPRRLRPQIPLELEAVCLKCLEKRPEDRYPSALALAEDLERFLGGQLPLAPRLTRWRRLRRWVADHRLRLTGTAAALAVIFGLVAAAAPKTVPHPVLPPDPTDLIRRELRAGQPVTLVGPTGAPRWHRWHLDVAEFGGSPTGDQTCYFRTPDNVLLELLDDPGVDSYTVSAELRLVSPITPNGYHLGVYYGRHPQPQPDTRDFFYAVKYWEVAGKARPQDVPGQVRVLEAFWKKQEADAWINTHTIDFAAQPLPFIPLWPGPWRKVAIHVTPESLTADWADAPDQPSRELVRLVANGDHFLQLWPNRPPLRRNMPANWSSRAGLGIWAWNCAACIRNVVITPTDRVPREL